MSGSWALRIVDLANADDPLVCLFDNLREQFEFFVNLGEDTRGLRGAVTCVLLPRFEQVAVPAGVIADAEQQFFHSVRVDTPQLAARLRM
jgi:hypothetical protein